MAVMIETGVSILQHPTAGPGLHDNSIHSSVLPHTRSQPAANPPLMGQGTVVSFKVSILNEKMICASRLGLCSLSFLRLTSQDTLAKEPV